MNEANADAIWERTLQTLRRDDTVSQRVIALLTLSRLMAVVADTALVAAPSTSAKELFEHRVADRSRLLSVRPPGVTSASP